MRGLVWRVALLLSLWSQAWMAWSQTVIYIHTDALGTPIAETDAAGNVIQTSEYAPYGDLLNRPDSDGPGYTGHVQDAATGMVYMQQRYYDPAIGGFLSVDPVGPLSDPVNHFNRYRYARNNPYRFVDPDGRRDVYIGGAADKDRTRIVQDYAGAQQQINPDRDIQYFSYSEKGAIAEAISAPLKEGEPLNVIGHSLGGREAIRQANNTDAKITNLVTIDPVGSAGDGTKPSSVGTWTDVRAAPSDRNSSDTVASVGRATPWIGVTATSGADSKTMDTNHGNFPTMMSKSGAQDKVDVSYQHREERR